MLRLIQYGARRAASRLLPFAVRTPLLAPLAVPTQGLFLRNQQATFATVTPAQASAPKLPSTPPAIWPVLQRYGFTDIKKFSELCKLEPRILGISEAHVDHLLRLMRDYGMLKDQALAFDMWLRFPKIWLKKAEKTERLLIVMWRLIGGDKESIGELVLHLPLILLCSVLFVKQIPGIGREHHQNPPRAQQSSFLQHEAIEPGILFRDIFG